MEIEPGPGASPFSDDLKARLRAAVTSRGDPPRTRHLRPGGGPLFTNRLALEASPYLLQHAHNPVDWRPWGDEAFAEARAKDKPVFLSVGYSTCHWCHVMEEESFEDLEIAEILNRLYVAIKVDREERPDVDSVYMQAVQLLTQHGGWPMSVFLAPDRKPFYGGTYFPPRDGMRGARVGFGSILKELHRVYTQERSRATEAGEQIAQAVRANLSSSPPTSLPGVHVLNGAAESYGELFDANEGGTKRAPKFPSSLHTRFLLRYWKRTGDEDALHMATFSLTKMALGGIYDQVGGGFHRYSTDAFWLVPHFEKMLYDNALLVPAYVEAWQATKDGFFRTVAEDVLAYVAREMTDPSGAFWSATDADSEGEEGRFFAWTVPQLRDALGPLDGDRAATIFNATESGNFEGSNVLSLSHVPDADERTFLDRIRPILREVRAKRPPPLTDRKIITAWNGLMISAFARAGFAFARKDLIDRAARAADHLLAAHRPAGKLARSSMGGEARHAGLLEDHAFLAAALVDLFEATGDARYLREGRALHAEMSRSFADRDGGAFFRTPSGHEELIAREKPSYDGAEPTGNSVAALTLLRLAALTGDDSHREECERLFKSFGSLLANVPLAVGEMLLAVDFALAETREVVIVRPAGGSDDALLDPLRQKFLPWQVLVRSVEGNDDLSRETPLVRDRPARDARAAAYVCQHGACQLPVTGRAELEKLLG
ncbi:MAG: thioredoxin domain-containing protein [Myxococcales bacterium]